MAVPHDSRGGCANTKKTFKAEQTFGYYYKPTLLLSVFDQASKKMLTPRIASILYY